MGENMILYFVASHGDWMTKYFHFCEPIKLIITL